MRPRRQKLPPKAPDVLHSYQVERKSEDFGATKVYEARAIYDGNRKVALVTHLKELADQRFVDELERTHAMMRMVPHPNIMRVFDYFSDDKFIFEVFGFNEGGRLSDHLHEKVRLRETHAGIVLYQLLGAVAEVHKARVFYGGTFRAEDVFVYRYPDRVRLGGFGLAKTFAELHGSAYEGDVVFAAPETFGKKFEMTPAAAVKVDVWGLGVLFYLMVTGSLPWRCDAELARNVRKGCYAIPDTVSEPCADVIRAMLCVRVRDRPTPSGVLEMPFLRVGEPKRVERKQTEHVVSVPRRRKRLAPSDSSPLLRTLQPELTAPVRKLRNARASPVSRSIPHTGMLFSGQEELPPLVKASPICAT